MTFTAEQRQKGLETRLRNKEQRERLKQNQATGVVTTSIKVGMDSTVSIVQDELAAPIISSQTVGPFDWHTAPLQDAIVRLSDIKREYDRAALVVLSRQSRIPRVNICWTQTHKELAGRTAVAQCKGQIPDGKSVFIDNGAKDKDGNIDPVHCCSMICYTCYQQRPRQIAALSRH